MTPPTCSSRIRQTHEKTATAHLAATRLPGRSAHRSWQRHRNSAWRSSATRSGRQQLPPDRRKAVTTLRALIRKNLPPGYREVVQYGIGWVVPLSRYPDTYNGQPLALAGMASQKHYISLYLMTVYGYPEIERWFKAEYAKSGKKLNMGECCLRWERAAG